eukprot:60334-Rhodomonas_salina.1
MECLSLCAMSSTVTAHGDGGAEIKVWSTDGGGEEGACGTALCSNSTDSASVLPDRGKATFIDARRCGAHGPGGRARECAVLSERMVLRLWYTSCGTERAYGGRAGCRRRSSTSRKCTRWTGASRDVCT